MIGPLSARSPRLGGARPRWIALGLGLAAVAGGAVALASLAGPYYATEAVAQGQQKPDAKLGTRPAAPAAATPAAAPSAPVRTETVVYDQWTVTCQDRVDGSAKRSCSALLKVVDPNRNQVVLAWMLGRGADGHVVTVMQTPTGVQVPRGVTLKLGEKAPRTLPFASCEPQNCEASVPVDPAMLTELKGAGQAVATIYAKDGRGIKFTMPLGGIDKALATI